ncbi:DgyrCDS6459 [Dimorphilus gyrociliatus]|uniref:DgyrCDS6459 n=1 Tax=Dimorphilus gyrociliatus TaxID=2664684 RepID=A0A7I8VN49_9ANNE|nr:DgyrCDS6459 [Dimorphilus gyrociliatus]
MSNPLTEERLNKIKDSAASFLESFGVEFTKSYALSLVISAQEKVQVYEELRKLLYRDFGSVPRKNLFSGYVYIKEGEGPGSFSDKWQRLFVAEQLDYNLAIYNSEEDFKNTKDKPKKVISLAGYQLTKEPRKSYEKVARKLSNSLGLGDDGIPISFSPFSWALTHDIRDNYVMQMHKGASAKFCSCIRGPTVEPEDVGKAEYDKDGMKWITTIDRCVRRVKARDLKSVTGRAFDMAVKRAIQTNSELKGFKTDGTEEEILMDLLAELCVKPVFEEACKDIDAPGGMRAFIYYKMRGVTFQALKKMLDEAWSALKQTVDKMTEKLEEKISSLYNKISNIKEDGKAKIRGAVTDKISEKLNEVVKPAVKPVFEVFNNPLKQGLVEVRNVLKSEIGKLKKLTNNDLDKIPRSKTNMAGFKKLTADTLKALEALKKKFPLLFEHVEVMTLKQSIQDVLYRTADAVVNTIELRLKDNAEANSDQLLNDTLKEFDYDAEIVQAQFLVSVMQLVFVGGFKRIVNPIVEPILDTLTGFIPDEVEEFVSIQALYDDFIELFVSEPIHSVVYQEYPSAKPRRKGEKAAEEEAVGEEAAEKEAAGEEAVGEEAAEKKAVGEEAAEKKAVGEEAAEKKAVGEEAAEKKAAGEEKEMPLEEI